MRTPVTARLRDEAAHFAFRFSCDDCAHFVAASSRCAHEYPVAPRRGALAEDNELVFCKEFELGG